MGDKIVAQTSGQKHWQGDLRQLGGTKSVQYGFLGLSSGRKNFLCSIQITLTYVLSIQGNILLSFKFLYFLSLFNSAPMIYPNILPLNSVYFYMGEADQCCKELTCAVVGLAKQVCSSWARHSKAGSKMRTRHKAHSQN